MATSTDGGAHLRAAWVIPRGNGRFQVVVLHPKHAGDAVWLRMLAWDDQAVEEAHRHGLPITAHAHGTQSIVDAVAAGVDGSSTSRS